MLFRYYRRGKHTKNTAYFDTISVATVYISYTALQWGLLYKDFKIPGMEYSKTTDYIIMMSLLLPVFSSLYILYPPKKVKVLYRNFRNGRKKYYYDISKSNTIFNNCIKKSFDRT